MRSAPHHFDGWSQLPQHPVEYTPAGRALSRIERFRQIKNDDRSGGGPAIARAGLIIDDAQYDVAVLVLDHQVRRHDAIESHVLSLPPFLAEHSIERIYDVARHLATWHPNTVQWSAL